jgi:transposase
MWSDSARRQYARLRPRYATDLGDAEFALLEPHLPKPARLGRPRTTDLREVLNAIFYLLRTGCQWRLLPKDFPPRSTVLTYFRRLWQDGTWSRLCHLLLLAAPEQADREASPSAAIVDSQSVRTTEAGGSREFDGGKRIQGRKRHILVDTLGPPLRLVVHPASVQDRDGLTLVLAGIRRSFPWLELLLADGGYQGERAQDAAKDARLALAVVKKPKDTSGFAVLPRRPAGPPGTARSAAGAFACWLGWVVERTFAWFGRNRRLGRDHEAGIDSSTGFLHLAAISLTTRRLATT